MFSNISWKDYSTFILVTVCIYYTIVFIIFYKTEIAGFLTRFNSGSEGNDNNWLSRQRGEEQTNDASADSVVEQLKSDITIALQKGGAKKLIKDEVMLSLQLILHNYDSIKQSESRQAMNNYIMEACENICSISLENEETDRLWFR